MVISHPLRSSGFNVNLKGLLADLTLRQHVCLDDVCTLDWVHSAFQDGAITCEMWLFTQAAEELELCSFASVEAFLKRPGWSFPRHLHESAGLHRIFSKWRSDSSHQTEKLKCSSSEAISLYGLFRHYVETCVPRRPELELKRASLIAAFEFIDRIMEVKRGIVDVRDAIGPLRQTLSNFMRLHVRAYGKTNIKPKHHWLFDILDQLLRDLMLLDSFTLERLHLRVRLVASDVDNTRQYEKSVLSRLLVRCMTTARESERPQRLLGPVAPLPQDRSVWVADSMDADRCLVSIGDMVFCGGADLQAAEVKACLLEDDSLYAALEMLQRVTVMSPSSSQWRRGGRHVLVRSEVLEQSRAWYWTNDIVTILRA